MLKSSRFFLGHMTTNIKPTIIFITQLYPFPPDTGGKFKTFGTIKALRDLGCKIKLFSFWDSRSPFYMKMSKPLKGIESNIIYSSIIDDLHPLYKYWKVFLSIFSFFPYRVRKFYSKGIIKTIKKDVPNLENPSIIYLDHLSSCIYLFKNTPAYYQKIYDAHDFESEIIYHRIRNSKSFIRKIFLYLEYLKLKKFEKKALMAADKVFAINEPLKLRLETLSSRTVLTSSVAVFGSKSLRLNKNKPEGKRIVTFIGTLSWEENLEGIDWFISKVWGMVKRIVKEAEFNIVGSYGNEKLRKKFSKYEGVNYLGYKKDLREIYQQTSVGIVPIFSDSGVKIKFLNFIFNSIPVVSTSMSAAGILGVKDSVNCFIADRPEEFAERIITLLQDKKLRTSMVTKGKKLTSRYYSEKSLREFFKKTLALSRRSD
ncbi:glycosyltransferase family 4 protein [Candidatus Collierbacteria bacterium]|nr:glycosyltransferase family 4 protein [Candidatus Collierbacteria bacterium]